MKRRVAVLAVPFLLVLAQAGCRTEWKLTKQKCAQAINEYYSNLPECLCNTPDPRHPALGKLCYGHRVVQSIDSFTPPWDGMPRTSHVTYRYSVEGAPVWARSTEFQREYPELINALSGQHLATDDLIGGQGNSGYMWGVIRPGQLVM